MGWDIHAQNPKRTFELLIRYFCKGSNDVEKDLLGEICEVADHMGED